MKVETISGGLHPEERALMVRRVRYLLHQIDQGEVRALGICTVNADGDVDTAHVTGNRWPALMGAAYELLCRLRDLGQKTGEGIEHG